MSVYKDKTRGTYYVKHRVNGKSTTKRGFKTKHEASLYELKLECLEEEFISIKLYDLFDLFLEYQRKNTEYGTYQKSFHLVNDYIKKGIKNKQINKVTELDCQNLKDYISGLNLSTSYKNDILAKTKQAFAYGVRFYRMKKDFYNVLTPFKKTRAEKVIAREREQNIWTIEEFQKFIDQVENETYKAFFTLLYFTGLRKGEAQALTWRDLKPYKLNIDKSLTKKTDSGLYEIKEPKTNSSVRQISLNKSLYEYLLAYKENEKQLKGFSEDWFMFGRMKPLPQTTIDRVKNTAVKNADVKNIRIHDFRHSHASNLINSGVNIVAVSKRLGHSSINITLGIYTHLMQNADDELINNLEKCSQTVLTTTKKA